MTTKEMVYKELCEMGKIGMDIKYPRVFEKLERCNIEKEFIGASISDIASTLVESTL